MIDRYEILRKLATGGMAELFLAKQSGLEGFEKVVVIKRILSHLAQDDEFVSMFLDEARIAAKLSHPNIVQIYDLGKADDSYYIAMEYVSGRNVQHVLMKQEEKGGLIPIEHTCRMIAGVCDGLHYAHSRKDYDGQPLNIVHRDISPQNILVSFAGGVKVVDFGIAKASTQLAQTRAGVLKGKYAYMSPEQVRGQKIDHRSDIFAVGLVMYEMLTGRRPFERESSLKTLKAIVQEKPLNPRELNPDIPTEVVKLLSRALEKNPDRRYKNAQEMQLAIEDYLESSPKKSNNVRLSRYLYELFDDELNSESGTMVVQGIGEVIIPTGGKSSAKPAHSEEEEIDSKTLSAALMPTPPEPETDSPDTLTAAARGQEAPLRRRKPSEPGVRVVRDDQRGSMEASAFSEEGTDAGAEPSVLPDPSFDADDSIEDEPEDKTIPVYSMEEYEDERQRRAAGQGGRKAKADDLFPVDDATRGGILPAGVGESSLGTAQDSFLSGMGAGSDSDDGDKARAAALLAKVDALAEGFEHSRSRAGAETSPPAAVHDDGDPEWENPTALAPIGDVPPEGSLHSDEAVVGPDGPVSRRGAPPVRPPATPNEIRPAARPSGRSAASPPAHAGDRAPSSPGLPSGHPGGPMGVTADPSSASHSMPGAPTPPPGPYGHHGAMPGAGPAPSALVEPTPPTAMSPRASGFRLTPPVIAALSAMGLLLLLTVVGVVALFVLDSDEKKGVGPGKVRILVLDTEPSGVELRYKGAVYKTPAPLIVEQGASATVEIIHNGKATALQLHVPVGIEPVNKTIPLTE